MRNGQLNLQVLVPLLDKQQRFMRRLLVVSGGRFWWSAHESPDQPAGPRATPEQSDKHSNEWKLTSDISCSHSGHMRKKNSLEITTHRYISL